MGIALKRGDRVVIASHNEGKVRELAELLVPFGIGCVSAKGLEIPEPEETGATFSDNAKLKAAAAAHASGMTAIADVSGLEVAALDGAPGIHSARWGGEAKDFGLAMRRVHQELEARGAREPRANSSVRWPLPRPKVRRKASKAGCSARWSGRRAEPAGSVMIRSSCRTATNRPSARWNASSRTDCRTACAPSSN
jgi:non-canonical purine NTP pyrophosphatase (RdgB/HAM1 family)